MPQSFPLTSAEEIALTQLLPPNGLPIETAQAAHRITLINTWLSSSTSPALPATNARILELGCGQGNMTAVLASLFLPTASIDALDPAPPTYGAPITLGAAQAHLTASFGSERLRWHRATLEEFLLADENQQGEGGEKWDVAVLSHCIWYFATPDTLETVLRLLRGRVRCVWVAEYALRSSSDGGGAAPHVLAALARGMLEGLKTQGTSSENIRTLVAPGAIVAAAERAGWQLEGGGAVVVPGEGLLDGAWETGSVVDEGFLREVEEEVGEERMRVVLRSARDAVVAAVEGVGGLKAVRTMDVWTGVLV